MVGYNTFLLCGACHARQSYLLRWLDSGHRRPTQTSAHHRPPLPRLPTSRGRGFRGPWLPRLAPSQPLLPHLWPVWTLLAPSRPSLLPVSCRPLMSPFPPCPAPSALLRPPQSFAGHFGRFLDGLSAQTVQTGSSGGQTQAEQQPAGHPLGPGLCSCPVSCLHPTPFRPPPSQPYSHANSPQVSPSFAPDQSFWGIIRNYCVYGLGTYHFKIGDVGNRYSL